ncbi:MAG TPA: metalloregulator ArsR/SmtB family transcription factor [Chthoniobacterales bacterium]|jgi:DNA-binding transcriptional ArsR family regulator
MDNFGCIEAIKALGEVHRLRILRLLLSASFGVNDLATKLGMSQYNVSKHLRVLREAGLVECQQEGRLRVYGLAETFRHRISSEGMVLDLGCCQFDFRKLPK